MTLHLDFNELHHSAHQVSDQCESLATGHLLSGNRIEDAQSGWVDASATALGSRLDAWQQESMRLLAQLGNHIQGFYDAASAAACTEEISARALRELGARPPC